MFHVLSTVDLNQPLVNVTTEGVSTAGEMFSLICIMETVEGVRPEDISITWTGPDGPMMPSGDNIVIEAANTTGNVTERKLVFSPLHTTNRGQYNCIGRISNVATHVSGKDSEKINVISKQSSDSVVHHVLWYAHILSPSSRCVTISQHCWHCVSGNRAGHHMYCHSGLCCRY